VEDLNRLARRFPLVARARPACEPLEVRVREVSDLARAAGSATDSDLLPMAATAHNKAALIASDCGMSELARSLCWRQHHVYRRNRPLPAAAARFALEPLVNLARLLIRGGDGESAHRMLDVLYRAVTSRADVVLDGTPLSFRDLTDSVEAHRAVGRWLWTVLLADGIRALVEAGRWEQALEHAQRLGGVGVRLLDGRQIAIVARCLADDPDSALALLEGSAAPTTSERCVAACLNVFCLTHGSRPATDAVADMVEQYLNLEQAAGLHFAHVRLGLAVIDLAGAVDQPAARRVARYLMRQVVAVGDGYAARATLTHAMCRSHVTDGEEQALSATVYAAGLDHGALPDQLMADLMAAVGTSESAVARHLDATGVGPPS
jgi:hypothetical protein